MEKISILGASGFVGSHLLAELSKEDLQIHAVSRSEISLSKNPRVQSHPLNLENIETWPQEIFDVDTIYYLMSSTKPSSGQNNFAADISLNLEKSVKLFERIKNPNTRLIFASSGGTVYGEGAQPHKETDPTNPISGYGIVKLATEKYLQMLGRENRFQFTILRIANPYGPWNLARPAFGVINIFIQNLINNSPIRIFGANGSSRDYIYIEDLTLLLKSVRKNPKAKNQIFNIGTGHGTSLTDIVANLQALQKFSVMEEAARSFDVSHSVLDIHRAKSELNWQPKTNLKTGIEATYRWRKAQDHV